MTRREGPSIGGTNGLAASGGESAAPAIDWVRLANACRQLLPPRAVVAARQELLTYDSDGLTLHRWQPPLVVLPETTEQVAALVRLCHREGVPFVARGSGTGLSGGAVTEQPALVIATSRMRSILDLDQQLGHPRRGGRGFLLRA